MPKTLQVLDINLKPGESGVRSANLSTASVSGISRHDLLTNKGLPNQHDILAISNLQPSLDAKVNRSGDTWVGPGGLSMDGYAITNIPDGVALSDPASVGQLSDSLLTSLSGNQERVYFGKSSWLDVDVLATTDMTQMTFVNKDYLFDVGDLIVFQNENIQQEVGEIATYAGSIYMVRRAQLGTTAQAFPKYTTKVTRLSTTDNTGYIAHQSSGSEDSPYISMSTLESGNVVTWRTSTGRLIETPQNFRDSFPIWLEWDNDFGIAGNTSRITEAYSEYQHIQLDLDVKRRSLVTGQIWDGSEMIPSSAGTEQGSTAAGLGLSVLNKVGYAWASFITPDSETIEDTSAFIRTNLGEPVFQFNYLNSGDTWTLSAGSIGLTRDKIGYFGGSPQAKAVVTGYSSGAAHSLLSSLGASGMIDNQSVERINPMRWHNKWIPATYLKHDTVIDSDWTMVANKETTDRPSPQAVGLPVLIYNGSSPTLPVTAKSVVSGISIQGGEKAYWVSGYSAYTVTGNFYRIFTVDKDDVIKELASFTASETGWKEFVLPLTLIPAYSDFILAQSVAEPDPSPTIWSGDWDYLTPQNDADPLTGQIVQSGKSPSNLRIHKFDKASADRGTELLALTPGDIIEAVGMRWSIQLAPIDNGIWVGIVVAPAQQGSGSGTQTFNFETVSPTPITIVVDTNYWLTNQLGTGLIRGVHSLDEGATVYTDDAYGVNFELQEAYISPDWDLLASPSGSSGSGGEVVSLWVADDGDIYRPTGKVTIGGDTPDSQGILTVLDDSISGVIVQGASVKLMLRAQQTVSGEAQIGTLSDHPLRFYANSGFPKAELKTDGTFAFLHDIQIDSTSAATGKVLTATDSSGNSEWQTSAPFGYLRTSGEDVGATAQTQMFTKDVGIGGIVIKGNHILDVLTINADDNVIGVDINYALIGGGGSSTYPNLIGDTGKPIGTDFTPPGWEDDTGYVSGAADVGLICGGYDNIVNQIAGIVVGGGHNFIKYNSGGHSVIVGGSYNIIVGARSFIGGGRANAISGQVWLSSIVGGEENEIASGNYGVIPGGHLCRVAGDYAFAFGRRAKANADGAFTISDSQNADLTNAVVNAFMSRYSGGYTFKGGVAKFEGPVGVGLSVATTSRLAVASTAKNTIPVTIYNSSGGNMFNFREDATGAGYIQIRTAAGGTSITLNGANGEASFAATVSGANAVADTDFVTKQQMEAETSDYLLASGATVGAVDVAQILTHGFIANAASTMNHSLYFGADRAIYMKRADGVNIDVFRIPGGTNNVQLKLPGGGDANKFSIIDTGNIENSYITGSGKAWFKSTVTMDGGFTAGAGSYINGDLTLTSTGSSYIQNQNNQTLFIKGSSSSVLEAGGYVYLRPMGGVMMMGDTTIGSFNIYEGNIADPDYRRNVMRNKYGDAYIHWALGDLSIYTSSVTDIPAGLDPKKRVVFPQTIVRQGAVADGHLYPATLGGGDSTGTGYYYEIAFREGFIRNTMFTMKVEGFNYVPGKGAFGLAIGSWKRSSTSSFNSVFSINLVHGDCPLTKIRFGTNLAGEAVIVLGELTDVFKYGKMWVTQFNDGLGTEVYGDFMEIRRITDITGYTWNSEKDIPT